MVRFQFCVFEGKGDLLQRVGRALHVSSSRNIIVKAERKAPRIGDKVVDGKLRAVGTIFDVFGPVFSPYVSIKPTVKNPESLVNQFLYVIPSAKRRRR